MTNHEGKKTILLVEDDPTLRSLCKQKLEDAGYSTFEAENGEKGLAAATDYQPDLILLDIKMPAMSGFDMLRRLRDQGGWGETVPVIFLTNIEPSSETEINDVLGLKPADYFIKGDSSLDELIQKVGAVIGH